MKSIPVTNGEDDAGNGLTCHACRQTSLTSLHTIHPHPLRGPSFESVLLTCTHCGAKRLHTRAVQGEQDRLDA